MQSPSVKTYQLRVLCCMITAYYITISRVHVYLCINLPFELFSGKYPSRVMVTVGLENDNNTGNLVPTSRRNLTPLPPS